MVSFCIMSRAQLAVTVSPPEIVGQKAIVLLTLKNHLSERIDSARAMCFLLNDQGKVVGESTKWVIGGTPGRLGLEAGVTNNFNFVITSAEPFTTTNLTAKISFSQLVCEDGKPANVKTSVQIEQKNLGVESETKTGIKNGEN